MTAHFSGVGYKAWGEVIKTLDKETTFANLQTMSVRGRKHVDISSFSPDVRLSIRFTGAKGFEDLLKMLNSPAKNEDVKDKAIEQFFQEIEDGNVILEKKEHGKRKAYGSVELIKRIQTGALELTSKNGEKKAAYDEFEEISQDQFKEIAACVKVVLQADPAELAESLSSVEEEEKVEEKPQEITATPVADETPPSPKAAVKEKAPEVKQESLKEKEEAVEKQMQEARDALKTAQKKEQKAEEKQDETLRHEIAENEIKNEATEEPPTEDVT